MTVAEIIEKFDVTVLNQGDLNAQIENGYAGDFLSNVVSKAPESSIWFTVMNNVNVCAVACLADIHAIVLCENTSPDSRLLEKCEAENITLLRSKRDVFSSIRLFLEL